MSKQFSVDPAKKAGAGDNTAAKKLGRGGIAGRGESPLPVSWILITGEEEGNCLLDVYFNLSCQRWETGEYKNPHCIFIWGKIWLLNHLVVAETSSHMIACLVEQLYQLSVRIKVLSSAFLLLFGWILSWTIGLFYLFDIIYTSSNVLLVISWCQCIKAQL